MNDTRPYLKWLLLIGLIGCLVYWHESDKVFPSASIELKLPKSQIIELSDQWKDKCGYKENKKDQIVSTIFAFDDDAKTFLEYELGQSAANELMRSTIPIWYWSTRYCKPLKQEEFTCWVNPAGELVSYDHGIENDAELPNISHEQALTMAREALTNDDKVNLEGYKLIEDGTINQAHRTDHYFTWEDTKQSYKGAKLRGYAYISGNTVTQINHFLYIPESWKRKFSKLRSYNDALEGVASIFYTALNTGVFFVFIWAFANSYIRWRFSLIVALVYSALSICESLNSLPSSIHEYATTTPWDGFLMEFALGTIWGGVTSFFQTFMLVAAVEPLYRVSTPKQISLEQVFTLPGLGTKQTLEAALAGVGTFGLHLGWLVIYYLFGRNLGLWCPLEVQNVETLSTTVPAFSAINIGFIACLTEELTYRVLGLAVFQRIVKRFWLANLLQAAAWAFMHSNYPQEPPYARGLELTVVGTVYGVILRRYGLLACLLSHNLVDSFLGLSPLFSAAGTSLQISAYVAIVPFILMVALPIYLRFKQKAFTPADQLVNSNFITPKESSLIDEVKHAPGSYIYKPLKNWTRVMLAIAIAGAWAIELGFFFPTIGAQAPIIYTRDEAVKKAREILEERGLRPDNFTAVAWVGSGITLEQFQYIYEKEPGRVGELAQSPETPFIWSVRFFKPNSGNEYSVEFDRTGKLIEVDVTQEEDEPGATLTKEEARKIVEAYYQKYHPEMLPYLSENPSEQKKEKRTDWIFTFKVPKYKVGDADYKVQIKCVGDQPSGFSSGWSVPESWTFKRKIQSWRERICGYIPWVFDMVFGVLSLLWARGVIRSSAIAWRPAIVIGLMLSTLTVAKIINDWPIYFSSYDTDSPLIIFFIKEIVHDFLEVISQFSIGIVTAAFGIGAMRLLAPRSTLASIFQTTFNPNKGKEMASNRQMWLDAALVGYAIGVGWQSFNVIYAWLRFKFSPEVVSSALEGTSYLVNFFNPALAIICDAFSNGLEFVFAAAIAVGLYAKFIRSFRAYIVLSLLLSLAFPSGDRYWQEYILEAISYFISSLILWLLVAKLARENLAAYFITAATGNLVASLRVLVSHGRPQFIQDIISVTVIMLIPLGYVLYASLNTATREVEENSITEPEDAAEPEKSND
jgi:Type II CAAX prenyl endopeptidase Rce1-like